LRKKKGYARARKEKGKEKLELDPLSSLNSQLQARYLFADDTIWADIDATL